PRGETLLDASDGGADVTESVQPHPATVRRLGSPTEGGESRSVQELGELRHETVLGSGADDALLLHTVLEEDQRGDAHHVVGRSRRRVVSDVALSDCK